VRLKKNEPAKMILMKTHMEQMESGNMKMMMDKKPEMKEKNARLTCRR